MDTSCLYNLKLEEIKYKLKTYFKKRLKLMVAFYKFPNRIWKLYGNIFSNNIEVKHRIVDGCQIKSFDFGK